MSKKITQEKEEIIRSLKYSIKELSESLCLEKHVIAYFIKSNNLKLPRYIAKTHKIRKLDSSKNINHSFFKTINENSSYILGFITADGCLLSPRGKSGRTYNVVKICLSAKDSSFLESIRDIIAPGLKIHTWKKLDRNYVTLQIQSEQMYNDLTSLGLSERKTFNTVFPNLPTKYISHFVRGYFDGDGCTHLLKRYHYLITRIYGTSEFLTNIANQNDLKYSIRKTKGIYELSYNSKSATKKFLDWIYQDSDGFLRLERKFQIYHKYNRLSEINNLSERLEIFNNI